MLERSGTQAKRVNSQLRTLIPALFSCTKVLVKCEGGERVFHRLCCGRSWELSQATAPPKCPPKSVCLSFRLPCPHTT